MAPKTPPALDFHHKTGFEIPTKHKEAIRQLHDFAKVSTGSLMTRYKLAKSTIRHILSYDKPERARITMTGAPHLLNDRQMDDIIEYCAESYEHRVMDYTKLHNELGLSYVL